MNNSWSNNSSSSGFIYFNQKTSKNPADTTDFLSFGENTPSPNSKNRFSPLFSPGNYGSPRFHSSPRKFNSQNTFRHTRGNQGNRSFNRNSLNNSYNSNHNNSRNSYKHRDADYNNSNSFSRDGKMNISHYYDHTCTLDPWAELQKELDKTKKEEALENPSATASIAEKIQEDESTSSDEESESEECEDSPGITEMT